MELLSRGFEQLLTRGINIAKLADLCRSHFSIAGKPRAHQALQLALARGLYPGANGRGILGPALVGQLRIIDPRHFNMDSSATQQGTSPAFLLTHDRGRRASTLP